MVGMLTHSIRRVIRSARAIAAPIVAALAASGCGFTPLYATPGLSSSLSSIDVVVPQGRLAYLLREDLDDTLARDKTTAAVWRLDVTVVRARNPRGLRVDNVAERYELDATIRYTLTALATGQVAHSGEVSTQVSYDAVNAPYAAIAGRQDSQKRVASDAARRIQMDLAVWMARSSAR